MNVAMLSSLTDEFYTWDAWEVAKWKFYLISLNKMDKEHNFSFRDSEEGKWIKCSCLMQPLQETLQFMLISRSQSITGK